MDRTRYPFNGAAPERTEKGAKFTPTRFPVAGAGEPLKGMALSAEQAKEAKAWDKSSAWFNDVLTRTWQRDPEREAAVERARRAAEAERERLANLFPRAVTQAELLDGPAKMGVGSSSGRTAQLRRQYRQVQGGKVLAALPSKGDAPARPEMLDKLAERESGQASGPREWVMVAKSELRELHKLEQVLRGEQTALGAQAALTFSRAELSAREPLPMTKLAVEDVCNREMKKARGAVERLSMQRRDASVIRDAKKLGYIAATKSSVKAREATGAERQGSAAFFGAPTTWNLGTGKPPKMRADGEFTDVVDSLGLPPLHGGQGAGFADRDGDKEPDDIDDAYDGGKLDANSQVRGPTYGTLELGSAVERAKRLKLRATATGRPVALEALTMKIVPKHLDASSARYLESQRHLERKAELHEREEMGFEEQIQRVADVYVEAAERKLDYQWYYVLACRYGALSPRSFNQSARPGGVYHARGCRGARGLQRLWRIWWPWECRRRYRAAMMFQAQVRYMIARKRWKPIIKFRMKWGYRKVLYDTLHLYQRNVRRLKRIRHLLHIAQFGYSEKCVRYWRRFKDRAKAEKEAKARAVFGKIMRALEVRVFTAWHVHAKRLGDVKRMCRRHFNNPCFGKWVAMTRVWRHERRAGNLALLLQRHWRGKMGRRRAAQGGWLLERLKWIARGKRARIDVGRLQAEKHKAWLATAVAKRQDAQVSLAVNRDVALREALTKACTAAAEAIDTGVAAYLSKGKGKRQLDAEAKEQAGPGASKAEVLAVKLELAEARAGQARKKAKEATMHNLLAASKAQSLRDGLPPLLCCSNPACGATFPTLGHLLRHSRRPVLTTQAPGDRLPAGTRGRGGSAVGDAWLPPETPPLVTQVVRVKAPPEAAKKGKKGKKKKGAKASGAPQFTTKEVLVEPEPVGACPLLLGDPVGEGVGDGESGRAAAEPRRDFAYLDAVLLFGDRSGDGLGEPESESEDEDDLSDSDDDEEELDLKRRRRERKRVKKEHAEAKLAAERRRFEMSGFERVHKFVERVHGVGPVLYLLKLVRAAYDLNDLEQTSSLYEPLLARICDRFIDAHTASLPCLDFLSEEVVEACLDEAASLRESTMEGRAAAAASTRGFFSSLLRGKKAKHGDPWGDGLYDPRPFKDLGLEARLALHDELKRLGWWSSEECAAWVSDAASEAHALEDGHASQALLQRRNQALGAAREAQALASERERDRAQRFQDLLEEAMGTTVKAMEQEVFDAALWTCAFEVADRWKLWSSAAEQEVYEATVDFTVDKLIDDFATELLTDDWTEQALEILLDDLLEEQLHREMGSKINVEAAIAHGLRTKASVMKPKKARGKGLLMKLTPETASHEETVAVKKVQGMIRSRRARRNLRKMLVSVWRKRYDPSSGYYFYENTITGENVWEAPPVFKRFFPDIDW